MKKDIKKKSINKKDIPEKLRMSSDIVNLNRDKTMETISDLNKSTDFTNATFRQLSSSLKMYDFNPSEVHTELSKNIYIIPSNKRKTSQIMSTFEYTRVLAERAKQIQNGSIIFVDPGSHMSEIDIAKLEIKLKKCPFIIRRMLNDSVGEEWAVNEMEMPFI